VCTIQEGTKEEDRKRHRKKSVILIPFVRMHSELSPIDWPVKLPPADEMCDKSADIFLSNCSLVLMLVSDNSCHLIAIPCTDNAQRFQHTTKTNEALFEILSKQTRRGAGIEA